MSTSPPNYARVARVGAGLALLGMVIPLVALWANVWLEVPFAAWLAVMATAAFLFFGGVAVTANADQAAAKAKNLDVPSIVITTKDGHRL